MAGVEKIIEKMNRVTIKKSQPVKAVYVKDVLRRTGK